MSEIPHVAPNTVETMLAKQDIMDVLTRYGRAIDRADGPLLKSCYFEDAIEEHGGRYTGNAYTYVDEAMERLSSMGVMAHYICNVFIDLDADLRKAYVEAYLLTFVRFQKSGEDWDTLTGGRICDRFECRDGIWKIAHRKLAFDWNRDAPSSEGWCLGLYDPANPDMIMGRKGPEDLSYTRF